MDPMIMQMLAAGAVEILLLPLVIFVLKHFIGSRLDAFDEKREVARHERAEDKRRERERQQMEHDIVLAITRTMLLDNYEKCMKKGYYTVEEREVYSALFSNYSRSGGNGVISAIAERIRSLPLEPPKE